MSGVRAFVLALATASVLVVGVPDAKAALGPNLLSNYSFEDGVNPAPPQQGVDQPLLPVGWAFEGSAGLFDHTPTKYHGPGKYSAAISIPASGRSRVCYDQPVGCHPLTPVNDAKATVAAKAFSLPPAWRPLNPISIQAGRTYNVSGWVTWSYATTIEGGALVRVRWLDANGVGIGMSTAVNWSAPNDGIFNWTAFSGNVTAPGGAVKAVPLFGSRDDTWNSNIAYDEVRFSLVV